MTTHRYVSWYRRGLAALRNDAGADMRGESPTVAATVVFQSAPHDVTVTLHGPGDVASLAPGAIVRRDPAPSALGVSPAGIAFVEMWPPDLPWRFSPAGTPGARTGQLTPWLALVVVPASTPFGPRSGATVPMLETTRGELPDPTKLWAWAHVQIEEPEGGLTSQQVPTALRDHPETAVARLLAPRRLEPKTKYRACVVPVFEAGRRAGLGDDVAGAGTDLAWKVGAPASEPVMLPVYDSWLIETGVAEDFEVIARRLRARDADTLFSPLQVDVRAVAGGTEPVLATTFGVVRPKQGTTVLPQAQAIAATLEPWLSTDVSAEPTVGPPLYGAAHTNAENLDNAERWQKDLNLDPRRRAQAAAGAEIVRADQEQLVADARAAAGELDRANILVRGAQLATLLSQRLLERHVTPRSPQRVLCTLWPLLAGTPASAAAAAPAPAATSLLSPAMRRLSRPAGPLARGRVGGGAWARLGHDLALEVRATPLADAATLDTVRNTTPTVMIFPTPLPATRLAQIQARLAIRVARPVQTITMPLTRPPDAAAIAVEAQAAAAPIGIARRVNDRVAGLPLITNLVSFVELRTAPDLSRPLADRLAQLRPELFAPGLAEVPPDSVAVLTVEPAAVQAVLVGANDELTRELRWRGVSIERKATLLRQMWPRANGKPAHDIAPISEWTGGLGDALEQGPVTVFIVRSELVRRFPTAVYSCLRAVANADVGRRPDDVTVAPLFPMFQGMATPDLAYVGFGRSLEDLVGDPDWEPGRTTDPGWYFAIQERPGHTRFGLDATRPSPPSGEWTDLSWLDLPADARFPDLDTPPSGFLTSPEWGATATGMAAITERPAVRAAFHVNEFVAR